MTFRKNKEEPKDEEPFDPDSYIPDPSNSLENGGRVVRHELWIGGLVLAGIAVMQFYFRAM